MKQVGLYCRVSTRDKQEYTRQVNELTKIAKDEGYKDSQIKVYAEKESGYKKANDRPELERLLKDCTKYECIYVMELSRIARDGKIIRNTIDTLTENKVPLYIKNLGLKTIKPDGKTDIATNIIIAVFSEIADEYARSFKVNSISGLRQSASEGKAGGGNNHPYGYMKDEQGMLVINPDEVPVIHQIFNLYKQGNGIKVISNLLNEQGIPTRTNKIGKAINHLTFTKEANKIKWSDKQIHDILRNTIFKGQRRFKGEILAAPAIIKTELFDACQKLMQTKTHRNYLTTYTYLLKDKCTCGVCQRNYFAKYKPVKGGDKAYVCSSKLIKGGTCGNKAINISLIESAVYDLLLSSDSILKYINNTNDVKVVLQRELEGLNQSLPIIKRELDKKVKEQSRLLDVYLSGDISKPIYTQKNKELESGLSDMQQKVKLVENTLKEKTTALSNLKKTSTTKKMLESAKLDRELLKGIFNQLIYNINIIADETIAEAHIRFQISGVVSIGQVRLQLDKKMIARADKVFRYKAIFLKDIEADILDDEDVFQDLDWRIIPEKNQIKVLDIEHG